MLMRMVLIIIIYFQEKNQSNLYLFFLLIFTCFLGINLPVSAKLYDIKGIKYSFIVVKNEHCLTFFSKPTDISDQVHLKLDTISIFFLKRVIF